MAGTKDEAARDDAAHTFKHPISNGPNARPRDESIASTAVGLPDDTSSPVDIDPEEEKRMADKLLGRTP